MQPAPSELKTLQTQLIQLFTDRKERENFLQSTGTEYATYRNINQLPKTPVTIYAELLKSTADGVMSSIFPALRTFFSDDEWLELLEIYLAQNFGTNYRLNGIAENFAEYLSKTFRNQPWLAEIADYEYQELAVEEAESANHLVSDTATYTPLQSQTDIVTMLPVLNETLIHRVYKYDVAAAVSTILTNGSEHPLLPEEATVIAMFRDPDSNRCRQLVLGKQAESVLLSIIKGQNEKTYAQILSDCLAPSSSSNVEEQLAELLSIINDFHEANLLIGNFTRASDES